jgi:hypothetical protein
MIDRIRTLLARPIFWLADELFELAEWVTPNFLNQLDFDQLREQLAKNNGLDTYTTGANQKILVHARNADCDEGCVIHNPSDHPMRNFPTHWRGDRGLMERICPHGVGHPDPDDLAYKRRMRGDGYVHAESVHGCCGCCVGSYE